jgi:hypothetical protein
VSADLRLESEGQRVHIVGDGTSLIVHSSDPLRLWSAMTSSALPSGVGRVSGPRAAGRAANALRDAGLRVDLTGPNGVLVALGDGAGTPAGRALTGSDSVGFGSLRAVLSTASSRLSIRKLALATGAALAVIVLLWRWLR